MIYIRGQLVEPAVVPNGVRFLPFTESGLEFIPGRDKCMARNSLPTLVVLHNTGGSGDGAQVYSTLKKRGLSVHFVVDSKGVVWQFCDPFAVTTYHVGPGNTRSIGIEVVNPVFTGGVKPGLFSSIKRYVVTGREKLYGRPVIVDEYRGRARRVLGHCGIQKAATAALVKTLLREFSTIPKQIPPPSVLTQPPFRVSGARLDPSWMGVASHLHFTDAHVDPAGDLYEALQDLG